MFLVLAFILSLFPANRKERKLFIFPYLLALGICVQFTEGILASLGHPHRFVFKVYDLFEYPLYAIYYLFFFTAKKVRYLIIASILVYISTYALYYYFRGSFLVDHFNSFSCLVAVLISSLSLYFYFDLIKDEHYVHLPTYPHFYINTANLIHFSVSLFAYSFNAWVKAYHPDMEDKVLFIPRCSNILMYILYCVAFACNIWARKKSSW